MASNAWPEGALPAEGTVVFFKTPAALRAWFAKHHGSATELWVGYYKVGTGKPSVTWQESVDEALCCGWIDGIRKRIDDERYKIRFTPRKKGSTWSGVNVRRVKALTAGKRMLPAGLAAFDPKRNYQYGAYSYEQRKTELDEPYLGQFKKHTAAFEFFMAQPPGYRKIAIWFIVSAKKEETRLKRLEILIERSASGTRLR
jgi:uncharacterized protein YdeI (YjbR/CyaY-like superfamily)